MTEDNPEKLPNSKVDEIKQLGGRRASRLVIPDLEEESKDDCAMLNEMNVVDGFEHIKSQPPQPQVNSFIQPQDSKKDEVETSQ